MPPSALDGYCDLSKYDLSRTAKPWSSDGRSDIWKEITVQTLCVSDPPAHIAL